MRTITYESIAEQLTNLCPNWAVDWAEPRQLREAATQHIPFDSKIFRERILRSKMIGGAAEATLLTFLQALASAGAIKLEDAEFK